MTSAPLKRCRDIWISKPSLHNPRVQHNCAEFNGKVYVVGGGGNPEPEVSDTCEVSDFSLGPREATGLCLFWRFPAT